MNKTSEELIEEIIQKKVFAYVEYNPSQGGHYIDIFDPPYQAFIRRRDKPIQTTKDIQTKITLISISKEGKHLAWMSRDDSYKPQMFLKQSEDPKAWAFMKQIFLHFDRKTFSKKNIEKYVR